MTEVIAHRGASRDAPENTLAAFELALEQGADMIETDLHRTADGAIAIHHDPDVAGAAIAALPLRALRERAPDLPTLPEVLDAFGDRIPFNLELKRAAATDYTDLERLVLDEVRRRGLLECTLFSSFRVPVLRRLRAAEPRARIGVLLRRRWLWRSAERARCLGAEAVHAPLSAVDPVRLERWRSAGLRIRVYTVDDPAEQRRLLDQGLDGVFTNLPRQLRELRDGKHTPPPRA